MNQYLHHIGDFNNATRHLTRIERSIYSDMIDMYYDTEAPLTLDVAALKRKLMARSKDEAAAVEVILAEFFTETTNGWFNERCDFEITKFHGSTTQKSVAGKASAAKREQARIKRLAELNGNSTDVEQALDSVATDAQQNPTNLNLKPITDNLNLKERREIEQAQESRPPVKRFIEPSLNETHEYFSSLESNQAQAFYDMGAPA